MQQIRWKWIYLVDLPGNTWLPQLNSYEKPFEYIKTFQMFFLKIFLFQYLREFWNSVEKSCI